MLNENVGCIAIIHPPEDGSGYGVTFPDLPGCVSGGATFEEAARMAEEALSGHLAVLRADGDPVPAPRAYAVLARDPALRDDLAGAVPQLVVPRLVQAEKVRVNISIDRRVLKRADAYAEEHGLTRSGLIERSLQDSLRPTCPLLD
jgi:predicted RNase H-like HicB family nuclease